MDGDTNFQQLCCAIITLYHIKDDIKFTMKWVDDEGDPCMLTSDSELNEAIRLYRINKEQFLPIHGNLIFKG